MLTTLYAFPYVEGKVSAMYGAVYKGKKVIILIISVP
jgi:hypothetical protein